MEKTYLNNSLSIVKMLIIIRIFGSQKWGVLLFLHAFCRLNRKILRYLPNYILLCTRF